MIASVAPIEPAMERHAALPDLQDLGRIVEVVGGIVDQHVAEPAADDDAEGDPDDEVVEQDGVAGRHAPQILSAIRRRP